jgi:hypothetical protein
MANKKLNKVIIITNKKKIENDRVLTDGAKRNCHCVCGSGIKQKKCCGKKYTDALSNFKSKNI